MILTVSFFWKIIFYFFHIFLISLTKIEVTMDINENIWGDEGSC